MIGKTISHYRILDKIGEGGMGVVYKAEDTLLNRTVALKFLHATDDMPRLLREARAAASLNHPNVCTVYEVDPECGFLVMEFVEGESLSKKIGGRPMPVGEAVELAAQICEGLKIAHLKGVVHRDVKSGNVLVTGEGQAKVLDFGLAKTQEQMTLTREGAVVGTPGYMAPEQMRGEAADRRTDIWAVGAVLHEMLTGSLPMGQSETLPEGLGRVVRKALAAHPTERYQHIEELLVDLRALHRHLPVGVVAVAPDRVRRRNLLRVGGAAAVGLGILVAGYAVFWRARQSATVPLSQLRPEVTQLTSQPGVEWFPSISPDGKWFIYSGASPNGRHIYLQAVGGETPLDLTPNSTWDEDQPVFSPDGERIAFRSSRDGGGIFVMGRTGEAARRVTSMGFSPSWSPDGSQLVFTTENVDVYPQNATVGGPLWTVSVETGETRLLSETGGVLASWSPHNLRIAYTGGLAGPEQRDIWTVAVTGGIATRVASDPAIDWSPVWSPDGNYLYFASDRGGSMNLWRVRIDEASGRTLGDPEAITTPAPYFAHMSVSADGKHIVYTSALITANIQELLLDTSGATKEETAWVTTGSLRWSMPEPSPDGEWVVFYTLTRPEGQLYIAHPDGTGLRRLTNSDAADRMPKWSPDGKWIAFFSNRSGSYELWKIRPDASGLQQLTETGAAYFAWSPDGSRMATDRFIFDPNRPWKEQTTEALLPLDSPSDQFHVTSWSRDGQRLIGQVNGEHPGIAMYSLASRTYERMTEFGEWPVWMPDSRRVLFVADGSAFYLLDTLSRQVRKVFSVTGDVIGPPRLTRDGKKVYYSRRVTQSDIWLCTLQ